MSCSPGDIGQSGVIAGKGTEGANVVVLEEILARGEETVHEAPQAGKYTDIYIYLSIYLSIDL